MLHFLLNKALNQNQNHLKNKQIFIKKKRRLPTKISLLLNILYIPI